MDRRRILLAFLFAALAPWTVLLVWGGCAPEANRAVTKTDDFTGERISAISDVKIEPEGMLGPFPFLNFIGVGGADKSCGVRVEVKQPIDSHTNLQVRGLSLKVGNKIIFEQPHDLTAEYNIDPGALLYVESLLMVVDCSVLKQLSRAPDEVVARVHTKNGALTGKVDADGIRKLGVLLK